MVSKMGKAVGVPTPACDAVVGLIEKLHVGQLVPCEANLDRLARILGIAKDADTTASSFATINASQSKL
eukprot:SAG31_NODE_5021_length_2799_cov_1.728519_1_plen_69_part_00